MRIIGCEHSGWLRFVDHHETYGPDVIRDFLKSTSCVDTALDLGAGSGRDLGFVHEAFPHSLLREEVRVRPSRRNGKRDKRID